MHRALGGFLALAVAVGLAGCGFGGPDPQPTADAAAQALGQHDVRKVEFAGPDAERASTELTAILDGMGGVTSTVDASDVEQDGDRATATLTWRWDVAGRTWTSRSPMTLRKTGDTWRVVWKPSLVHPELHRGEALQATTVVAPRGDILGAGGAKIVTPRDVVRYGIDKVHVPQGDAAASARALATLVGVDPAGFAKRVRKAGAKAFVEAVTLRKGSPDAPPDDAVRAVDGALMVEAQLPLAPTRTFAAPILGTVGTPTAEMVRKSKGTLSAADQVGLSGLQARYDDQLGGTAGLRIDLVGKDTGAGPRSCSAPTRSPARRSRPRSTYQHRTSPNGRWPAPRPRVRWWRSGRRPATSSRPRAGRPRTATTPPPTPDTHPGRRSRSSAALPCCDPGSPRPRPSTARRR